MAHESIIAAVDAVAHAEAELLSEITRAYPEGSRVKVTHWRGEFFALVLWHKKGGYLSVRNVATGKKTDRYFAGLELVAESQP